VGYGRRTKYRLPSGALLINMFVHAVQTAYSIGVKSFTFATFAILALVVWIIIYRNGYEFSRRGFGS
jgi:hypothetical protein